MNLREKVQDRFLRFQARWFPERQIFLRSEGDVRYFGLSPKTQMIIAGCGLAVAVWALAGTWRMVADDVRLDARARHIKALTEEKHVLTAEVRRLKGGTAGRLDRLEERQRYLDALVKGEKPVKPKPQPQIPQPRADGSISGRISAVFDPVVTPVRDGVSASWERLGTYFQPRLTPAEKIQRIRQVEDGQVRLALDIADRYKRLSAETEKTLGPLRIKAAGLVPVGMGGPYIPDRLSRLPDFRSDEGRMQAAFTAAVDAKRHHMALLDALKAVPVNVPTSGYYVSSTFGTRVDPFNDSFAYHSGLDMVGRANTPITAAAAGKVVRASRYGAYGNFIEIRHANGFSTRYGHLNKLLVQEGQAVDAGQRIGLMGATGRATTTHLHYEVLINGRQVNPLPYVRASHHVLEIKDRS